MNSLKIITFFSITLLLGGCATTQHINGPKGPKIITAGHATQDGAYAEIGIEFSSIGDFVAFVSPSRWKSPVATGGALSWMNPSAWQEDWDRTSRIFVGQAVIIGGAVAVAVDQNDSNSSNKRYNPDDDSSGVVLPPITGPITGPPPPPAR